MKIIFYSVITLLISFILGCDNNVAPKPYAYPHIQNGNTQYSPHKHNSFPLKFNIANNATTQSDTLHNSWINIKYPEYNATIYCSFITPERDKLSQHINKSRELVYVHSKRSSGINVLSYADSIKGISAELYVLKGKVATPLQFIVTDNSKYLFRGSLYFDKQVNNDSVAPIVEYIQNDIIEIIESIKKQ